MFAKKKGEKSWHRFPALLHTMLFNAGVISYSSQRGHGSRYREIRIMVASGEPGTVRQCRCSGPMRWRISGKAAETLRLVHFHTSVI